MGIVPGSKIREAVTEAKLRKESNSRPESAHPTRRRKPKPSRSTRSNPSPLTDSGEDSIRKSGRRGMVHGATQSERAVKKEEAGARKPENGEQSRQGNTCQLAAQSGGRKNGFKEVRD